MRRALARAYPAIALLALASLAFALHGQRRALAAYRARQEKVVPALVRLRAIDRLVGRRLPDLPLTDPSGGQRSLAGEGRARVAWFVDVQRCAGCLTASLGGWQALLAETRLKGVLVLLGADRARAARIAAGAGVRSGVLSDPGSRAGIALGLTAPWVAVVTDTAGRIVQADAGFPGPAGACGAGFFQRITALYSGDAPVPVPAP
jgi:hypothetical protein